MKKMYELHKMIGEGGECLQLREKEKRREKKAQKRREKKQEKRREAKFCGKNNNTPTIIENRRERRQRREGRKFSAGLKSFGSVCKKNENKRLRKRSKVLSV